jgi:serine/threonine-protein kinase
VVFEGALGKYRVIAEIGRGGMANVYLAVVQGPLGFNKLVVVKKARPELTSDPEFLAMFLDEARLAARLNHPNVVQTLEVGQDGEQYFIAMEYLDGQALHRIRGRTRADFGLPLQLRVLCDTLAGLHHAHELCDFDGTHLNVVHRDVSPQNVFVTFDGVIKVVDFGIAKAITSSAETRAGVIKGKVTYMAPEQVLGQRVDRRADVFAVGVMLWESLAGTRMWKGVAELLVVEALVTGRIPSIRDAAPGAPEALASICDRALAASRDDRYASAQEMHDELVSFLDGPEGGGASARDVGELVARAFAEERARARAMIGDQLRDLRWSGTHSTPPVVSLLTPPPPSSRPPSSASERSHLRSTVTNATASLAPPVRVRPRLFARVVLSALAAALFIVGGVRLFAPRSDGRSGEHRAALGPSPDGSVVGLADAGAREPVTEAPAAGEALIKLVVRVTPATAKVYLDDALLSAGGFEGRVAPRAQVRRIRVEAPEHVPREELVELTNDIVLRFVLERRAAAAPTRPLPRGAPTARPAAAAH